MLRFRTGKLPHFLDVTMAGLALLFAHFYVLAVIEINMVGQLEPSPIDR
jgi:hypothetical protein